MSAKPVQVQRVFHSYQVSKMCGLAGMLGPGGAGPKLLAEMASSLAHRGPDDEGIWCDQEAEMRPCPPGLAIVDLSPMGHQPMLSADGRLVLAFNGEIYNHLALRKKASRQRAQ